jgi:hypothetical protein
MKLALVTKASGMLAGLELWRVTLPNKCCVVLVDRSVDGRFAADVTQWNSAVGLNTTTLKKIKDAATK